MDKKEYDKLRSQEEIGDLQKTMSTTQGRRFIWRLLSDAHIFSPCFNPESEGARRNGLVLLGEVMEHCPESYLLMQREAINNAQKRKAEIDSIARNRDHDHGSPIE